MSDNGVVLELYGTRSCPYTAELRERLLWEGREFTEYDVDADADARRRMVELTEPPRMVPVLVADGRVTQVGWHGRGCVVG